jgi:transposase
VTATAYMVPICSSESKKPSLVNGLIGGRLPIHSVNELRGFGKGFYLGYDRRPLMDKAAFLDFTVEVVRRLQGQSGFAVQPRRWVVERSFAWLLRWRRLVRDYEQRIDVSQNMMYIAMGSMLMHRIFFR